MTFGWRVPEQNGESWCSRGPYESGGVSATSEESRCRCRIRNRSLSAFLGLSHGVCSVLRDYAAHFPVCIFFAPPSLLCHYLCAVGPTSQRPLALRFLMLTLRSVLLAQE